MSGGTFDYKQNCILIIFEDIEEMLERQGKEIPKEERYYPSDDEQLTYETYSENVQIVMREAIHSLKRAYIFAKRLDWYLAGDDGEESLYKRLSEELAELEKENL